MWSWGDVSSSFQMHYDKSLAVLMSTFMLTYKIHGGKSISHLLNFSSEPFVSSFWLWAVLLLKCLTKLFVLETGLCYVCYDCVQDRVFFSITHDLDYSVSSEYVLQEVRRNQTSLLWGLSWVWVSSVSSINNWKLSQKILRLACLCHYFNFILDCLILLK